MSLEMYRGDTPTFNLAVTIGGVAADLAGIDLTFSAKKSSADTAYVFQKTIGDGITVTDAAGGLAEVQLSTADTASLPAKVTRLEYDVEYNDGAGTIFTIDRGTLEVLPDITITA